MVYKLNALGPAAQVFKVDICPVFRHIRIDSGDIDLLGLCQEHIYYINLSLPFSFRSGSFFFQKLNDGVCYIMNKHGYNAPPELY